MSEVEESPKEKEPVSVDIGLGDIIQIVAPTNSTIHDQIYLILYIDEQKIKLINASNASRLVLTMSIGPSGGFTDESITGIKLLDSPEHPEYARQNDLLPGKWIDIHFGGDLPTIITGQITDLENDRIEIKAYPGEQVFYIDFEYKGIPENIPIEQIRIRSPPTIIEEEKSKSVVAAEDASDIGLGAAQQQQQEEVGVEPISISRIRKSPTSPGVAAQPPVEEIQTALKEILFDADSIVFGEELEPIVQFVELPEEQKRYSIENQTSDLLNELVSKYPNAERTKSVLNNIHTIIERFQQLRDEFSNFDANGNAVIPERRVEHYKPLAKSLLTLNQKLFWLLPVAKNIRKFYNTEASNVSDFSISNMEENLEESNALFEDYASNKESFLSYISKMNAYLTPFTTPDTATTQFIQTNITAVLDNLNDFYSSIVKGDKIKRNRFVIQTYNMGLSHLQIKKGISYGRKTSEIVEVIPTTKSDKIDITSYLSLPEPAMNFSNISLPNTNIMRRADANRHFIPYWNLLRKNTSITQKMIEIQERESHSQYSSDEISMLASSFVSFVSDQDIDSDEKYRKFIEMFIPNTELLIDVMSKYVSGSITLSNYVAVLQPFMVYMRDLTTRQYSVFASMIEQKVLEYKKMLVQTAREYAAISSAKYAAKYAASSSLYNLLKDSRQVDFETDILSIYGLAPENYKNVDNRQQNTPSRSAGAVGGGGGGGGGGVGASTSLGPPPSKTEFDYDISSFAKTPIERAIAMSAKKVQAKNGGEINPEDFDDVVAVYNEVKKSFPDDFGEMIRMRDDKSLVQSEIVYPIIVAMVKADTEYKRMKQQLERREQSAVKSISSIFPDVSFTNSEILYRLICVDNARLYMNTMAIINEDLVTPFDFDQLYTQEKKKYETRLEDNHTKNECKNFVLTKKYNDALEMRDDEDVEVHYDKLYDFTDYDFLKKLEKERKNYSAPDFETFLTSRYMKKTKLPMHDAKSEIRDMLRGKRLVQDGQYAVLVIDDEEGVGGVGAGAGAGGEEADEGVGAAAGGVRYEYFIRNNGKWVKDDTIPSSTSMYDTSYFCNVKSNCFAINKKCMTPDLAEDALKDDIITKMYDEFDSRFHQSRKQILDAIYRKYNYSLDNIQKMTSIRRYNAYKYNDAQYLSGIDIDPSSKERISPYARIFDLILGQTDYVKRQKNIMRFIQKFTRKAIEASTSMSLSIENESPYWLYCKETNTKLVPSFFETIASVFLNQGDIMLAIDTICKERGSISEDGDAWTDKYSGYVIKQIDMDTDEGYDAAGYKLQSRDVIEKSIGETLIQSIKDKKIPTFKNPDAQMISGILTTMTKYMGIDLESQRVFIVESAMRFLYSPSFPKEEAYNSTSQGQASSARKMSYKTFKNMTILVLTLAFMIVSIQVSIPPIKTKKTFPGCIRSFVGYPIDGDGDNSSLKYVACIAFKIKSGVEPWDTLSVLKTEDKLVNQIQSLITSCVLKNSTYQTRIAEKREYNKVNVSEELPAVHDIRKWNTFLPPLSRIKIRTPEPLSPLFKKTLQEELSRGQGSQVEKISAIKSKIIYYSLAIQMMIQNVVDREKLILTTASNEPFVENACCNPEGSVNTIQYFVNSEPLISDYEAKIRQLRDTIEDITDMQKSVTLLDPTNTRTKYPQIPTSFQEDTIYMAFIAYCKFNTDVPVPENIQHLCHNKPPASLYDKSGDQPIKEIIEKLKSSGEYIYTEESLYALLDIVNREHIIPFDFSKKEISYAQQIRDLIQACQSQAEGKCDVPEIFMQKILAIMDTYDYNIKMTEDTQELRDLMSYLAETNTAMVGEVIQFLNEQKRMDGRTQARFVDFLTNPASFRKMGVGDGILCPRRDTATYKGMQFVLNQMRNLVEVYPNLILNNIDYKKISVPKHWGLSKNHVHDIQSIIKVYYSRLDKFLKDKDSILKDVMKNIKTSSQDWLRFATYTPLYARVIDIVDFGVDGEDVEFDLAEADIARGGPGRGRGSARGQGGLLMQGILESGRVEASSRRKQKGDELAGNAFAGPMEVSGEIVVRGQYSIFNDELIRYVFTHYLLNVIMKYIKLAKSPHIVVEESAVPEGMEQELMSVLEAQDEQNGVGLLSEMSFVASENVELKKVVAELLGVFINMMISDKAAINVNKKSIKEDITQSKDKEKDIITRELRDMQQDERQVENLMKKLRIGDWNVGGTKGLRFYVPETYDQEREAMESEFQREEALAKQENRIKKNDKVTQRMRDVFTTEQEENMQQDALVDAEIEDDFRLQGDDDEYGADDDGEFNQRDGGFGDGYD